MRRMKIFLVRRMEILLVGWIRIFLVGWMKIFLVGWIKIFLVGWMHDNLRMVPCRSRPRWSWSWTHGKLWWTSNGWWATIMAEVKSFFLCLSFSWYFHPCFHLQASKLMLWRMKILSIKHWQVRGTFFQCLFCFPFSWYFHLYCHLVIGARKLPLSHTLTSKVLSSVQWQVWEAFFFSRMSRILLLFLTVFVAAQIPDGCVDCGVPEHPNCQVGCDVLKL